MKRRLLIFGLLALLAVAAVTAWHYRARLLPHRETSEIFLRYHDAPGIQADFVKNFHINDTITVDVTVLHATDSTGWACLVSDFNLQVPSVLFSDSTATATCLFPKGHPGQLADPILVNNDLMLLHLRDKTLYIFSFIDETQFVEIIRYKYRKYNNPKKNTHNEKENYSCSQSCRIRSNGHRLSKGTNACSTIRRCRKFCHLHRELFR